MIGDFHIVHSMLALGLVACCIFVRRSRNDLPDWLWQTELPLAQSSSDKLSRTHAMLVTLAPILASANLKYVTSELTSRNSKKMF